MLHCNSCNSVIVARCYHHSCWWGFTTTHVDAPWRCHHSNVAICPTLPGLLPMSSCVVIKWAPTFILTMQHHCKSVLTTHWYIALTVSHGGAIISSHLQMTSEAMDLGFNIRCNQEPVMMLWTRQLNNLHLQLSGYCYWPSLHVKAEGRPDLFESQSTQVCLAADISTVH